MARTLLLPELGENISEGTLVRFLVSVGDVIEKDQPIAEVETEKAVVEVPAPEGGKVKEILAREGERLGVGEAILALEDEEGAGPQAREETPPVSEGADLAKEETKEEKASAEKEEAPVAPKKDVAPREVPAKESKEPLMLVPASPRVRRLARELGLDISQAQGSGPHDRITEDDVKRMARDVLSRQETAPREEEMARAPQDLTQEEPLSSLREAAAKRLAQAWSTVAHVTQHDLADITEIEAIRREYAKAKVSMTAIAAKASVAALKLYPRFNASLDLSRKVVILKRYYHIGVAVDTSHGLLVPVLKDADKKSIVALSGEIEELASRARERKLKPEEMQGATFTVTNLGGIGGTGFTPIVNWPEVAILGVSRAQKMPFWQEEKEAFLPRLCLPLSLSYDHRLLDGADAARFLRTLCEILQNPRHLLLEL